ncbi:MAG: 4-hydroxythreonine-4-phosphate dehydrogenase PdxA, partial [Actinomycetospora chiangmaiensis]|nr:4-hydroxythreonine-4-phosphate dehydrogenase PdxA [Actinomycetospora chiangmaiensis]
AAVAGLPLDVEIRQEGADLTPGARPVLLDLGHCDPATIRMGQVQRAGGAFALRNFRVAIERAASGLVDAVCFTPFNKAAMRLEHPTYDDEIGFTAEVLGRPGIVAKEFNILDGLWNARITSHVPLSAVASLITHEAVLEGLRLTDRALKESGFAAPRIAVAGLNPHAGDGGNFGHEDDAIIAPAIRAGRDAGIDAEGPFPPDTVFVRATRGAFDAVLTMYHDQGQIAMKLIGFDRGVTLLGGFPFPICTPAHGSAYDIAGQGKANFRASQAAVLLAARMAAGRRATGAPA